MSFVSLELENFDFSKILDSTQIYQKYHPVSTLDIIRSSSKETGDALKIVCEECFGISLESPIAKIRVKKIQIIPGHFQYQVDGFYTFNLQKFKENSNTERVGLIFGEEKLPIKDIKPLEEDDGKFFIIDEKLKIKVTPSSEKQEAFCKFQLIAKTSQGVFRFAVRGSLNPSKRDSQKLYNYNEISQAKTLEDLNDFFKKPTGNFPAQLIDFVRPFRETGHKNLPNPLIFDVIAIDRASDQFGFFYVLYLKDNTLQALDKKGNTTIPDKIQIRENLLAAKKLSAPGYINYEGQEIPPYLTRVRQCIDNGGKLLLTVTEFNNGNPDKWNPLHSLMLIEPQQSVYRDPSVLESQNEKINKKELLESLSTFDDSVEEDFMEVF
jgi:hypothetical protein